MKYEKLQNMKRFFLEGAGVGESVEELGILQLTTMSAGSTSFPPICHARYINILTWLRGFQDKLVYLVLFSLYPSLLWE